MVGHRQVSGQFEDSLLVVFLLPSQGRGHVDTIKCGQVGEQNELLEDKANVEEGLRHAS